MFSFLIIHIFYVYALIFSVTGCHYLAFFTTGCLIGALYCFQLPKSSVIDSDEILQPTKVSIIAHRGAGHDAPENTLSAIKEVM